MNLERLHAELAIGFILGQGRWARVDAHAPGEGEGVRMRLCSNRENGGVGLACAQKRMLFLYDFMHDGKGGIFRIIRCIRGE